MPKTSITIKNTIYYTGHPSESGIHMLYAGHVIYLPDGNIGRHAHGHYELCLFTEGIVEVSVGDKIYTVYPGDLLLTKPGELHSINSKGKQWGKLYIGVDVIDHEDLSAIFKYCPKHIFPNSSSLEWVFKRLIYEVSNRRYGMSIAIESLLNLLFVSIGRILEPKKRSSGKDMPHPVAMARIYIESNPYHDMDLEDVAKYSCLSKSRLSCVFVRETGISLRSYLKQVIMYRALRLLEDDKKSISDIAAEFRYPSVQYFSTVFHKFWGYTPRDYRNSARKHLPYK